LIFADAPYADDRLNELADLIFRANLLDKDGWLVIEHSKRTDFSHHPFFKEMRHYGNVHFSFFRRPE
jgi:16S rRNA G966 N2-methylase RsmD